MGELKRLVEQDVVLNLVDADTVSDIFDLTLAKTLSVQSVNTVVPSTAVEADDTEVELSDSSFNVAHSFITGTEVALTASATPPAPLSATDYYVIVLSPTKFQLAATLEDALAGIFIELIDGGSVGNENTFTPDAISAASMKIQQSNSNPEGNTDPVSLAAMTWSDLVASQNITASGTLIFEKVDPTMRWARIYSTITAGSAQLNAQILIKGEQV